MELQCYLLFVYGLFTSVTRDERQRQKNGLHADLTRVLPVTK